MSGEIRQGDCRGDLSREGGESTCDSFSQMLCPQGEATICVDFFEFQNIGKASHDDKIQNANEAS